MHRDSRNIQPSPPMDHFTSSASRWLVITVALFGALAGASVVETIAALTSGANISFSPGHIIAEPLAIAGALSGGLLAAILASRDRHSLQRGAPVIEDALVSTDLIPSEPMMWQPAPPMFPNSVTITSTNMPSARSNRRIVRIHHRIRPRMSLTSHLQRGRLGVSRPSTKKDTSRLP